jgi:hypothetical protein
MIFHNKGNIVNPHGLELVFNDKETDDMHNRASWCKTKIKQLRLVSLKEVTGVLIGENS